MTRDEQNQIRERLQALTEANAGRLTPQAVVEDARDTDSPLHSQFQWDDALAAEAHRLDQARALIRSVEVIFRNETVRLVVPAYVRDPEADPKESGYIQTKTLRSQTDVAREVVVQEFARAAHVLRRAEHLAKALGMEGDVRVLIDGITALRDRVGSAGDQVLSA